MDTSFAMVAKTLYGLEDVLADELRAIGADDVQIGRRMVSFSGDKEMLYKANFCCRTALRILKPVSEFKADHADMVYQQVKMIEWERYLSPEKTFAVDAVVYSDNFNHSKFVAYRTKDAIADYFNDKYEKRPSVRINNPDVYIHIHISHDNCTVSLDSSGESLHKRGYRVSQVDAPLNEVLAAGMILKSGWHGESNFIDPMCGSGTLLIEAAMIALNMSPGIFRKEYAFERWSDFDRALFDEIYNDDSAERSFAFKCYGSDISPMAIEKAEKNVRSAGLSKYIELQTIPFQQYADAPQPGILVMNPPYGERISAHDILELYTMIGERLKHVFSGYNAWILSYKDECFDKIGLRPKHRMKLMNGDLECEYRCYELFEGKNKDYKRELNADSGERDPRDKRDSHYLGGRESSRGGNRTGGRFEKRSADYPKRRTEGFAGRRTEGSAGRRTEGFADRRTEGFAGRRTESSAGRRTENFNSRSSQNKKFAEERLATKGQKTPEKSGKFLKDSRMKDSRMKDSRSQNDKHTAKKGKPYDRNRKSFKNKGYGEE